MTEPPGGLACLTAHTITSWEKWTETLSEVREKGYGTNIEELEYGYISVAAPVLDGEGKTIAALSVGGSAHRVTVDRIPELAKVVREAASRVSDRLGYRGSQLRSWSGSSTRNATKTLEGWKNETDPPLSQ
jgi:IclR family acetate operon transcriptional repressor